MLPTLSSTALTMEMERDRRAKWAVSSTFENRSRNLLLRGRSGCERPEGSLENLQTALENHLEESDGLSERYPFGSRGTEYTRPLPR